ncbi:MAG: GNAT family N-acetyltransferase [Candidatus Bathyarchaeota archaeon]|nr:MAG: GNAT family N-acetyltransferase [Candidatus Bathyarchaeota archaeon]
MSIRIRKVRPSDLDAILEISQHIWEGHDYLPFVIKGWLKDPNSHTYGLDVGNHVVAVANLRIIEEGRTGWMEGLRVHPDHSGKGFANAMTNHIIRKAVASNVQRIRYTTSTENPASLKLAEKFGFIPILKMAVLWHSPVKVSPFTQDYPKIRKSSPSQIFDLLEKNPYLMPNRILVYDWKALDTSPNGLKTLGKTHEFYLALKKGSIDSLSYAYLRRRKQRLQWIFTIHATQALGFASHFQYNLSKALEQDCEGVTCTYETAFEETLHQANWLSDEHWSTHMVLLEKPNR